MSRRVAVFRPDDGRIEAASAILDGLGIEAVPDPMLAVEPTGESPREDAAFTVLTSKTGVELAATADWRPGGVLCAIGDATARAFEEYGYTVDLVPEEFSSLGLVEALSECVEGERVEVARSDHGSAVLTDGLDAAGAYVHESVLYELRLPVGAGKSAESAAAGELDGALFTSSLTVERFLETAETRGCRADAIEGLNAGVVGAIGEPTRLSAEHTGIEVDVVPDRASFEALARTAAKRLDAGRTDG